MQAARGAHHLGAGVQQQVVGVAEHELLALGVGLGPVDALERGIGADGHESGGVDGAVGGMDPAHPGPRLGGPAGGGAGEGVGGGGEYGGAARSRRLPTGIQILGPSRRQAMEPLAA